MTTHALPIDAAHDASLRWPGAVFGAWPLALILVGAAGLAFTASEHAWHGYITAFAFWASISLGALFFVLVHHLAKAQWSVTVRRIAEAFLSPFPLLLLLCAPLIYSVATKSGHPFVWADPKVMAADRVLQAKAWWLDNGFFVVRQIAYFSIWTGMALFFRGHSRRQDEDGDLGHSRRMEFCSAPCMLLYAVTVTAASIDWLMSLDPHWFSTMFGVYFFSGALVANYSATALVALRLRGLGLARAVINLEHYHDLGKMMFAFVVFWAYIAFSQFMLIWYANLPEETVWYKHRWEHGWAGLSLFIVGGHFFLPFIILMSRHMKRFLPILGVMAVFILCVHYADLYFIVMPTAGHGENPAGFHPALADVAALVGVGGLWLATVCIALRRAPLVPLKDPRLPAALSYENL